MRQPIYNLERPKIAIFLNLRTFKKKFPLFSILALRETKTTIPENRPKNLIYFSLQNILTRLDFLYTLTTITFER